MSLLSPLGQIYGSLMSARNALYDRGTFRACPLGAKTISVGNITTGGTGKTPIVSLVADILARNGEKVCVLTRGYGRRNERERVLVSDGQEVLSDADAAGDEPIELSFNLLGKAAVISDADRVAAAKWAIANFSVTAFVLDDAFQHRRAVRDLDVVCIDATDPFGGERVLPAGRLREALTGLSRADVFVITRSNLSKAPEQLKSRLRGFNRKAQIFESQIRTVGLQKVSDLIGSEATLNTSEASAGTIFTFCGLGNPESFFSQLGVDGFNISGTRAFPDHHVYTQNDIDEIQAEARASGARALVTTRKDATKLQKLMFDLDCFAAVYETVVDDSAEFERTIMGAVRP